MTQTELPGLGLAALPPAIRRLRVDPTRSAIADMPAFIVALSGVLGLAGTLAAVFGGH